MSEQEKLQPSAEAPAPPESEAAPLSTGKRNALLRYMAILFGVAFLLVLLSFLIQMRDSRETISDLHQSNASALENAWQLQEENQALSAANEDLQAQLEQARSDLGAAEARSADAEAQLEAERQQLRQAQADLDAAERAAEDARIAGALLASAQAAWDAGDRAALDEALAALEPLQESLSKTGQARYQKLLTAPTEPAEPTEE